MKWLSGKTPPSLIDGPRAELENNLNGHGLAVTLMHVDSGR
jgi:hypothetical protein